MDSDLPIRVRVFGRFDVDGAAADTVGAQRKDSRRPLALLALLLGCPGWRMEQGRVLATLWGDEAIENPRKAFEIAVHRLRKLLGDPAAIVLKVGLVQVDATRVGADIAPFDAACEAIHALVAPSLDDLRAHATRLGALYEGPYAAGLAGPGLDVPRERYRRRFVAAATRLGELFEAHDRLDLAGDVYAWAIERAPSSEALCRRLMLAAHRGADMATGAAAYRLCVDALRTLLGVGPAAETLRLARELGMA